MSECTPGFFTECKLEQSESRYALSIRFPSRIHRREANGCVWSARAPAPSAALREPACGAQISDTMNRPLQCYLQHLDGISSTALSPERTSYRGPPPGPTWDGIRMASGGRVLLLLSHQRFERCPLIRIETVPVEAVDVLRRRSPRTSCVTLSDEPG